MIVRAHSLVAASPEQSVTGNKHLQISTKDSSWKTNMYYEIICIPACHPTESAFPIFSRGYRPKILNPSAHFQMDFINCSNSTYNVHIMYNIIGLYLFWRHDWDHHVGRRPVPPMSAYVPVQLCGSNRREVLVWSVGDWSVGRWVLG